VCICRGSGLPLPKVYIGPSPGGEENTEDEIDSCAHVVTHDNNGIASSGVPARDLTEKTLTYVPACEGNLFSVDGSDMDSLTLKKATVPTYNQNGERILDSVVYNHNGVVECLSERDAVEKVEFADQHSPGADADHTIHKRCKDLIDNSDRAAAENSTSTPISIPGSDASGAVNGDNCPNRQRPLGTISEDSKPLTPLTSSEVGSVSSAQWPSFYNTRRRSLMSNPRFTPAGSFIIPPDEDIYVDYSCGLFSTEECHTGGVLDVSTLPSPPHRAFTIGDNVNDETDSLSYYSLNESVASALTQSCQFSRSREMSVDSTRHHSDSEINKQGSTDVRVEMIDATSRDVLDEIFKRTSGTFAFSFRLFST